MRSVAMVGLGVLLVAPLARGAGFEKAVPWSGRYAGMANAATGLVEGSQSLFFNPAGLALGEGALRGLDEERMWDLSLNFSPTFSRFSGPTSSPTRVNGDTMFSPIFAGFLSYRPIPKLGIGAGVYVSAGTNAKFSDVDFSGFNPSFDTLKPTLESKLDIIEASLGAGYELFEGLRIGGGWRMSFVQGKLSSAVPVPAPAGAPAGTPPVALTAITIDNLTATDFTGFRVGIQYAPRRAPFGLGVMWRTPVNFTADGDVTSQLEAGVGPNGPTATLPPSTGSVTSQLPSQIAVGGFVSLFNHSARIAAEYTFTHYQVDRILGIDATIYPPTGAVAVPSITLNWDNQHVGRFGFEVFPTDRFAVRLGYAFVSQVTPSLNARPTLASPGFGHSVAGGTGYVWPGGLRLDGTIEYAFASGTGTNEFRIPGTFGSNGIAAHLGFGYAF